MDAMGTRVEIKPSDSADWQLLENVSASKTELSALRSPSPGTRTRSMR
jgi:hypothetical protein